MTFSREYQKSGKAGRFLFFGGWMLRKSQGEPLKLDHVLAFCQASFPMTLSWAGFLRLAPGTARQASLSITTSQSSLKLMSIELVMPFNLLVLCHPLLLLPSVFPSLRVFSNELVLGIRWPAYWSFSFCISPSHEYSGLISFRIDWFRGILLIFLHTSLHLVLLGHLENITKNTT